MLYIQMKVRYLMKGSEPCAGLFAWSSSYSFSGFHNGVQFVVKPLRKDYSCLYGIERSG